MGRIILAEIKPEYHDKKLYRGERNNNPGNLVNTPENWQGEVVGGDDTKFMQFVSAIYGIRALGRLLINYQRKYKIATVDGLIARWAPRTENDTDAYAKYVASYVGVDVGEPINVVKHLRELVLAIIMVECDHRIIYTDKTINAGLAMARGMVVEEATASDPELLAPYILCVSVRAATEIRGDEPGHHVEIGGTAVWLPDTVFAKHALYLNDKLGAEITPCEISAIIAERKTVMLDTALVTQVRLHSSFDVVAVSPSPCLGEDQELACVEDANHRAEMQLREYLEFTLTWAINGMGKG